MKHYPTRLYGIAKVLDDIENIIMSTTPEGYDYWLKLSTARRKVLRKHIKNSIESHILGEEWWRAIADTTLTTEGINTSSPLFNFLNRYIFKWDTRKLLVMLNSVKSP